MEAGRIAAIPLFSSLSEDELATVAGIAEELEVEAGATLAVEGDFGHAFYAVEVGRAEVQVDGAVVGQLGPGDTFGEIALLKAGRRTASVVALTSMRLILIFKRDLWRIESSSPQVAEALRATIATRLGLDPAT